MVRARGRGGGVKEGFGGGEEVARHVRAENGEDTFSFLFVRITKERKSVQSEESETPLLLLL